MLHKSGKRTYRKTFTMRLDIGIKPLRQDLTPGEIRKDTSKAFNRLAEELQQGQGAPCPYIRQVCSPGISNLMQLQG